MEFPIVVQEVKNKYYKKYLKHATKWHSEDFMKFLSDLCAEVLEENERAELDYEAEQGSPAVISGEWVDLSPTETLYTFLRWLWRHGSPEQQRLLDGLSEAVERYRREAGWLPANPEAVKRMDHV